MAMNKSSQKDKNNQNKNRNGKGSANSGVGNKGGATKRGSQEYTRDQQDSGSFYNDLNDDMDKME